MYFARVDVVPEPVNPLYWDVDSAFIELYFFSPSPDRAEEFVNSFLKASQWRLRETLKVGLIARDLENLSWAGDRAEPIREALGCGIGFRIFAIRTGGDDTMQPGVA
jgi:hypothetical protein